MHLVTVILPTKNAARFLSEALACIVGQTHPHVETVVVDDHSSDGTREIVSGFKGIRLLSQDPARPGLAEARNQGIKAASGEFIAFMSADDIWEKTKLEAQARLLEEEPEIQFVVTRVRFFLQANEPPPPGYRRDLIDGDFVGYMPESLMVRSNVFDTIGGFDPEFDFTDDIDWFARAKDQGVVSAVVNEVLVARRIHAGSITFGSNFAEITNRGLLRLLRASVGRQRSNQ